MHRFDSTILLLDFVLLPFHFLLSAGVQRFVDYISLIDSVVRGSGSPTACKLSFSKLDALTSSRTSKLQ